MEIDLVGFLTLPLWENFKAQKNFLEQKANDPFKRILA
jgi:hypothetical protein